MTESIHFVAFEPWQKQQVLSETQGPPETSKNPIFELSNDFLELFEDLEVQIERISEEMRGRSLFINDLTVIVAALDRIQLKGAPYDASVFDVPVKLDDRSPVKAALPDDKFPDKEISLWSVLVYYNLREEENSRPATEQDLVDLINGIKEKQSGLSSVSNETQAKMNAILANRNIALDWAKTLTMEELKLLLSMIRPL
jgi:hypothetical protein